MLNRGNILTCSYESVLTWSICRSSGPSARLARADSTCCDRPWPGRREREDSGGPRSPPGCPCRPTPRRRRAGGPAPPPRCRPASRQHRRGRAGGSPAPPAPPGAAQRRPHLSARPGLRWISGWFPRWSHTEVSSLLATSSGPSATWSSPGWSARCGLRRLVVRDSDRPWDLPTCEAHFTEGRAGDHWYTLSSWR